MVSTLSPFYLHRPLGETPAQAEGEIGILYMNQKLANRAGASLFDIFSQRKITYSMGLYDLACAAGPTLGPIVAGFAVVANGWRWAFWEMLWITGFALVVLSFSMPEVGLSFSSSFFFLRLFFSRIVTGFRDGDWLQTLPPAHLVCATPPSLFEITTFSHPVLPHRTRPLPMV
jgi:MFS family permease